MISVSRILFKLIRFVYLSSLMIFLLSLTPLSLACSSRSLPKPRPSSIAAPTSTKTPVTTTQRTTTTTASTTTTTTTTTSRPNITFPTFKCPGDYDAWYCLNEATCFTVKIGDAIMYNCECAIGFVGARCEFKDLDGSYQPKKPRPILEKASIASGATCILLFLLFVCLTLYLRYDQKASKLMVDDNEDGGGMFVAPPYQALAGSPTYGYNNCRFCTDKYCCSSNDFFNDSKFLLENAKRSSSGMNEGSVGGGSWFRQHIEAFPMGFTIKRFNKI
ncbi:protein spitz [Stomoxys calcitrans]|uniref:EGF-like domain-containing protein n=1 Tax=Stomoxys calcitrans TaxID=35570 RepID=A0A1I8Q190_STOCA|nr:protein spitz [Stomoxys calcitrans]XP_013097305.1 protein spitz [Stomoxys calcitrans]XP_013097306.1 protein spitz [Stomoxys calcitrans]XP_013097308.1 protein spitz [Stomoxys calcitrans]XP_059220585.1 protein spitz [Stomoxys calcitrans]